VRQRVVHEDFPKNNEHQIAATTNTQNKDVSALIMTTQCREQFLIACASSPLELETLGERTRHQQRRDHLRNSAARTHAASGQRHDAVVHNQEDEGQLEL
jgi:hypothetical protein